MKFCIPALCDVTKGHTWTYVLDRWLIMTDCLSGVQQEQPNRITGPSFPFLELSCITKRPRVAIAQVFDDKGKKKKHSWPHGAANIRRPESICDPDPDHHCKSTSTLPTPSLVPSDLHPRLFWLITPNVVLIKTGGVKGFSSPEKRVQIVAQWQIPSLAWEEMHPDNARAVPKWPEPD